MPSNVFMRGAARMVTFLIAVPGMSKRAGSRTAESHVSGAKQPRQRLYRAWILYAVFNSKGYLP